MIFKSLEIQGFKSFPDKLHIDFHDGLTGIVGPNGSGKSNISDAIRWVLGEQSTRTLRGAKMEDVIFAGAAGRRPSGYAEVSLTLDNSAHTLHTDYEEVTVTRRYYRSGDGEYYINRKSVRLKDVHELFMDTGLVRDGYSVIGQVRIDEILSVRSEDRREIFDEAAGISKYRYRKEEAERKLAAAEENLSHAADLVKELEDRLGPLEKQAQKERRYNELRGEQKGLEVSLWLRNLDAAAENLEKNQKELEAAVKNLEDCKERIASLYAQSEKYTQQLRELEHEKDAGRALLQQQESEAAGAENTARMQTAALERNLEDLRRLAEESADYDRRIAAMEQSIRERQQEAQRCAEEAEQLAEKVQQMVADLEEQIGRRRGLSETENALLQKEEALRTQETALQTQLAGARTTARELEDRLQTLESEASSGMTALEQAKTQAAEGQAALSAGNEKLQMLDNQLSGYARKLEARENQMHQTQEQHTALRIRLGDMQNRIRMLRELEREYEGYSKAVRAVMTRQMPGVRGPVSSLLRVDDDYVAAIETALGGALQNIVVDREEDARSAIGMLKNRNEGRATFLPMTAIRGGELDDREFAGLRGVMGIASRLIRFDAAYTQIFRNLLGRTMVMETLDDAIAAARATHHRYRLVTLDGQLISPGGAMTGGSLARSTGILSRANELQRLTGQESECASQLQTAAAKLDELRRDAESVRFSMEALRTERQTAQEARNQQENAVTRLCQLAESLEAAMADRDSVQSGLRQRLETQRNLEQDCLRQEAELAKAREALAAERAALSENREEAERQQQEQVRQTEALRGQQSAALARRQAALDAGVQLENQKQTAVEDRARRKLSAQETEAANGALRERIAEAEQAADVARKAAEITRQENDKLQQRRESTEGKRTQAEQTLQEENRQQVVMERENVRLETRRDTLQKEQDKLAAALWDEYGLTRTTAREEATPLEDPAQAQKRADELRRQIRALGSVYTGAIEEYEQVKSRYDFLTAQRDDAETSRKQLIGIIGDLQKQMKVQFADQFKVLSAAFSQTFQEVFGGGQGKLELDDPENVLESGIQIKVQLPGKALKVLSLLSGGEKAFVAIALYFSILKVRPAAFCILDEIDAALDDVNVSRFAQYLRKYLTSTQFIVITHRRHTMEAADTLYGVAMPTQGVSRMLELDVAQAIRKLGLSSEA